MTQTATQIRTKLNQFLCDIWETTSLPDFGMPSYQMIYEKILNPKDDDDLATLRGKLYLLAMATDNLPDLDEKIAQNIHYYAEQVDYDEHRPSDDPITIDDLPF